MSAGCCAVARAPSSSLMPYAARPAGPGGQLLAASRAFRHWATTHVPEFGLLFGAVFAALVAQIWLDRRFPVPAEEEIEPALRAQLAVWGGHFPVELPLGVLRVFLSCWLRLYGPVCMEIFGHLRFALEDAESLFEDELRQLADMLGIGAEYRPAG